MQMTNSCLPTHRKCDQYIAEILRLPFPAALLLFNNQILVFVAEILDFLYNSLILEILYNVHQKSASGSEWAIYCCEAIIDYELLVIDY